MVAPCVMLTQRELLIQWLGQLSKEEREEKLLEVMDYMADGTIKPPPPSEPFICSPSAACMQLSALCYVGSYACAKSTVCGGAEGGEDLGYGS